jgi:SagB-type dehydrogenase family enzyme
MTGAKRLPARVVAGFVDEQIARLLDLDRERELPLLMVPLGEDPAGEPEPAPEIEPLGLEVRSISPRERVEPAIVEMHAASALGDQETVRAWREGAGAIGPPAPSGETWALRPLAEEALPDEPLEAVIQRRGSSRRFRRDPLSFEKLSTVLKHAIRPMEADFLGGERGFLNQPYLIANAVEGLPSGSYRYHPGRERLERLRPGRFRDQAGELALGQALGADAAVCMYCLTDLGEVLGRFGDRGYRAAQLEAAALAGRVYLACYALGFGATGLTFFDDAVTAFFSPQAEGKSVMFLIALGVPAKRGP